MLLADMGAEVLRIDRAGGGDWPEIPVVSRGRSSLALDLKDEEAIGTCLTAIDHADVLIEGFRPGVMERLGLGPQTVLKRNRRLIYGRVTGWGQDGPMALLAGHDINYVSIAGALAIIGDPARPPSPPLNLLGDYAGGSLYLVMGILAALHERMSSGCGQVIDAAIVDGVSSMLAPLLGMRAAEVIEFDRARNVLGGTEAPHYRCYTCLDGRHIAVGPLEPRFRAVLSEKLGLAPATLSGVDDKEQWARLSETLATAFAERTRDEWAEVFAGSDACVSPVLTPEEAAAHPQLGGRGALREVDGLLQPAPAPRFSRTPGTIPGTRPTGLALLADWCS
jgi:alpha-methylacyl-CoA racemase